MLISVVSLALVTGLVYGRPGSPSDWEPVDVPSTSPAAVPATSLLPTTSLPQSGPGAIASTTPSVTTSTLNEPGSGDSDAECTNTNITPTDIPYYQDGSTTDIRGIVYATTMIPGYYVNQSSPNALGNRVFGPSGPNANSWKICISECADWCANNASCHSFNVFTFEESDYSSCEVTCECRPVRRTYNKDDYAVGYSIHTMIDAKLTCSSGSSPLSRAPVSKRCL